MSIHDEIKQSNYVLFSDLDILVVQDFDPISKGHALILPQDSYLDIDDLPHRVLLKIFKAAQVYIQILERAFPAKGYSMMQNGGKFNDIDVFHLHVFPRFDELEFGFHSKPLKSDIDINKLKGELLKQLAENNIDIK